MKENRECFLSLLDMVINHNFQVERNTLLPHSDNSIGELEENGYVYLEPSNDKFEIKIPLPVLYHISKLLKEKNLPYFPILNLDYKLSWEENEFSDLQLILIKIWNSHYQVSIDLADVFELDNDEILVEQFKNLYIHRSNSQITSFEGFYHLQEQAFVNGKGAPWGDSGIKLKMMNSNTHSFKDYFYIIIQSKRKETSKNKDELEEEWQKIYSKELDDFIKSNVLFIMISDGEEITDMESRAEEYKCILITKDQYSDYFSDLFLTLKELKSGFKEIQAISKCKCTKKCQCVRCECQKKGLCGENCKGSCSKKSKENEDEEFSE